MFKSCFKLLTTKMEGGMVTDFSGTSILSNEFVVICRASTDNLGVLLGLRVKCVQFGHRWQKVAQKPKYERNDIELVSFHYWMS